MGKISLFFVFFALIASVACVDQYGFIFSLDTFDSKGLQSNGKSCDIFGGACDLGFKICVHEYTTKAETIDFNYCPNGYSDTGKLTSNKNSLNFISPKTYGAVSNPLSVLGESSWNGMVVKVKAYDDDGIWSSADAVDSVRVVIKTDVPVQERNLVAQGIRKSSPADLTYSVTINCIEGFSGNKCQVHPTEAPATTLDPPSPEATTPTPTAVPTAVPTSGPIVAPTAMPTTEPTAAPIPVPTAAPTPVPTDAPIPATSDSSKPATTLVPSGDCTGKLLKCPGTLMNGIFGDPSCPCATYFFNCANGIPYEFKCAASHSGTLAYNPSKKSCDYESNVSACPAPQPTVAPTAALTTTEAPAPTDTEPAGNATQPLSCTGTQFKCSAGETGPHADPLCPCAAYYFTCSTGITYKLNCPSALVYNSAKAQCDYKSNVSACSG